MVARFAEVHFRQEGPAFDAAVALLVVALSTIGILRNLPRFLPEPTAEQFGKSMIYTVLGVVVAGALGAVAADTEG